MSEPDPPLTHADVQAFVARLVDFDATELDPRERSLLRAIMIRALDPLERRRVLGTDFTADQLAVLDRLEAGQPAHRGPGDDDSTLADQA